MPHNPLNFMIPVTLQAPKSRNSKAWAKALTNVSTPARTGMDFHGEFLKLGVPQEVEPGQLIIRIDPDGQASFRVACENSKGDFAAVLLATSSSDKGAWCSTFAALYRQLEGLAYTDLVVAVAQILVNNDDFSDPEAKAFWTEKATGNRRASLLARQSALLAELAQIQAELAL